MYDVIVAGYTGEAHAFDNEVLAKFVGSLVPGGTLRLSEAASGEQLDLRTITPASATLPWPPIPCLPLSPDVSFPTTPQSSYPLKERGTDKLRSALKLSGFVDVDVTEAGDKLKVGMLREEDAASSLLSFLAVVQQSDN